LYILIHRNYHYGLNISLWHEELDCILNENDGCNGEMTVYPDYTSQ